MSDDQDGRRPGANGGEAGGPQEPEAEPSVLGNLPRRRPTVRSPRREAAATSGGSSEGGRPSGGAEARTPPSPSPSPGASPSPGPLGELEGLAREGAAAAVGAASLGLRIAGRAATALRDAVERH